VFGQRAVDSSRSSGSGNNHNNNNNQYGRRQLSELHWCRSSQVESSRVESSRRCSSATEAIRSVFPAVSLPRSPMSESWRTGWTTMDSLYTLRYLILVCSDMVPCRLRVCSLHSHENYPTLHTEQLNYYGTCAPSARTAHVSRHLCQTRLARSCTSVSCMHLLVRTKSKKACTSTCFTHRSARGDCRRLALRLRRPARRRPQHVYPPSRPAAFQNMP
jgi:hypothetical protein